MEMRLFERDFFEKINDEIIAIRQNIHSCPELGNKEFRTAALIKTYLNSLKIEICEDKGLPETAVVGLLRCASAGDKDTLAFRADIDALALDEKTDLPWKSRNNGIMHACGHDFHTAALLGTATMLAEKRDLLNCNIMFIFQPDEEGFGGAERIVDTGIFEKYRVNRTFGAHVDPTMAAGKIGLKKGGFYAAADIIQVSVQGRGCHAAEPENGIDALRASAEMVTKLTELSCAIDENGERRVVSIGCINSGVSGNIIADSAYFKGIARTFGVKSRMSLRKQIENVIYSIADKYGANVVLDLITGYPGIFHDAVFIDKVHEKLKEYYGQYDIEILEKPRMTTEDFGIYLSKSEGCFFHFGVGGEFPLHHAKFYPDDNLLGKLSEIYCVIAESFQQL